MSILLDFVNVRGWSLEALQDFYRKHQIAHSAAADHGEEVICRTKTDPELSYFMDESAGRAIHEDWERANTPEKENPFVLPTEDRFSRLWLLLKSAQLDYRDFLDRCIRGSLDLQFVNSRITEPGFVNFSAGGDPWTPVPEFWVSNLNTIEAHVDYKGIIFPLWRGEGETFSRVTRCDHCGNYFFAKSRKARFCSDLCRRDDHRGAEPKQGKLFSFF